MKVILGLGAGALAVVLLLGGGWWAVNGGLYGCSAADERLGPRLVAEQVLPVPPDGLAPVGPVEAGRCDEDDQHVEVWQQYRSSGPVAEVTERYRAAAVAQGWRPAPDPRGIDPQYCKDAAGTVACLRFGADDDGAGFTALLTAYPGGG
ncbi:hypothetical protein AB0K43_09635 [Kitasatospora sp. NPDC049258]|uniref:hypothetical protein n=1 Tax=Kitasatospora sp. NPDC049258 TaxID=3155394 RepID=UPI00342A418B